MFTFYQAELNPMHQLTEQLSRGEPVKQRMPWCAGRPLPLWYAAPRMVIYVCMPAAVMAEMQRLLLAVIGSPSRKSITS